MGEKFTWQPKFTRVIEQLPDELFREIVTAIVQYGTFGIVPELEFPCNVIFESLKDDIDYSKAARAAGKNGGRGNKKPTLSDDVKGGSEGAKPPFSNCETPLSDCEKGGLQDDKPPFSGVETPLSDDVKGGSEGAEAITLHNSTVHNITKQYSTEKEDKPKRKRFAPPTPEEVQAYADEKGYIIDPERFCDFYASKGWKVGSSPMKDWKAAVRNWCKRASPSQPLKRTPPHREEVIDEYSLL